MGYTAYTLHVMDMFEKLVRIEQGLQKFMIFCFDTFDRINYSRHFFFNLFDLNKAFLLKFEYL